MTEKDRNNNQGSDKNNKSGGKNNTDYSTNVDVDRDKKNDKK